MSATPSAQYRLTIRVKLDDSQGMLGLVTGAIGDAGGMIGAGVEDLIGHDAEREAIGAAYLAAASHAYGGADGTHVRLGDLRYNVLNIVKPAAGQPANNSVLDEPVEGDIDRLAAANLQKIRRNKYGTTATTMNGCNYL